MASFPTLYKKRTVNATDKVNRSNLPFHHLTSAQGPTGNMDKLGAAPHATTKLAVTSLLHRFREVLVKYVEDEKLSGKAPLPRYVFLAGFGCLWFYCGFICAYGVYFLYWITCWDPAVVCFCKDDVHRRFDLYI